LPFSAAGRDEARQTGGPADRDNNNVTLWEMNGSRTHLLAPGMLPVDDDGYLSAVLRDVLHHERPDRKRIFLQGSRAVQEWCSSMRRVIPVRSAAL
jgi:hypothetical protein